MGADIANDDIVRLERGSQLPHEILRMDRPGQRVGKFCIESVKDCLASDTAPGGIEWGKLGAEQLQREA